MFLLGEAPCHRLVEAGASASGAEASVHYRFGHGAAGPPPTRCGVAPVADAQGRCDGVGSEEIGSKPFGHCLWPKGFLYAGGVAGRSLTSHGRACERVNATMV
jgi:hypothetical protein